MLFYISCTVMVLSTCFITVFSKCKNHLKTSERCVLHKHSAHFLVYVTKKGKRVLFCLFVVSEKISELKAEYIVGII